MSSDFVERWVKRSEQLAARYEGEAEADLAEEVASLVAEARREAEPSRDAASLLERVSGRLRVAVPDAPATDQDRSGHGAGTGRTRGAEALSALALQFSRIAGEVAGSPT